MSRGIRGHCKRGSPVGLIGMARVDQEPLPPGVPLPGALVLVALGAGVLGAAARFRPR